MAIRLPPRRNTTSRNSHLPDIARRTLDAVTPIIQQQNTYAHEVAGYPVLIYRRLTNGVPCTCSRALATSGAAPLYDADGHAAPSTMNSIIQQASYGIEEYNPETPASNLTTEITVVPVTTLGDGALIEDEDEYDLTTEMSLNAFSGGACAICFGSGYVGGYHFLQGQRWIFDCSAIHDSNGLEVNRNTGPFSMEFTDENAWVEFRLAAPLAFSNVLPKVGVYDNFNATMFKEGPARLLCVHDDPTVPEYQLGPNTFSHPGWVTLRLNAADMDTWTFTHVDITLPLSQRPTYVDIPNPQYAYDPQRYTQTPSTTISLPPTVPLLQPWDVICDIKTGLSWLVTNPRAVHPATGSIWTQEADVRPMDPHEPQTILPHPEPGWQQFFLALTHAPGMQPRLRKGAF